MSLQKLNNALQLELDGLYETGSAKGKEMVIVGVKPAESGKGPRYYVEGLGDKEFLKMNSNSYLGMSLRKEVIQAEENAAREFGVGPGAVRFISGTYKAHTVLEQRLAKFHNRPAGMIFSSAYVTSLGVLFPLITRDTVLISDELNHNCIIMAIRLSKPAVKGIYKHNDMQDFESKILENIGKGKRVIAVTDGIFSMRGDNAPLDKFVEICEKHNDKFDEGIISIIDDSHGVGAFGKTGRGTEEYCGTKVDIVIGTLGKSFGVNGGYVVASKQIIEYLREKAPMYIYSNPITVPEASAALKAIEILDSSEGLKILEHLRKMTKRFEAGLKEAGYETIEGEHPVVPIMIRDTKKTSELVKFLVENGILATGLNFPVVPKGDEEIRIQISADHTINDIDYAIEVLQKFKEKH
ncbi:MAG: aminotransferase class I/II-fold pyridoxal phosphate-dependent enzyme [Deltaproteobacteria bacterium]|nr:aminotransferase class I/II-fold pyridoxal phosphate-dependent enzyme [Deltaproteobacteria bacterium]NNK85668.1 aminotransferase class I/II-fold pyridoxal phosphate-dependent enzyme [Desulfobacterales bacterium]